MNIEARKLHFIEDFLALQNETLLAKLELILKEEQKALNPILKEKLTGRALKAEQDIVQGKVMTRKEMEERLDARLGI